MTKSRQRIAPKHAWSDDDDQTLRINYAMWPAFLIAELVGCTVSAVWNRAHNLGLYKSPDFWKNPHAHRWSGHVTEKSKANRFKPGQVPLNKGLRRPGWSPGRMATTQFKKGTNPTNWQPIGSERVDASGYHWRKLTDNQAPGQSRHNWTMCHVLVWEQHNGPVPAGHAVIFRDGCNANIVIDNLQLISRADLMRRNTIHRFPPALADVIRQHAGLKRRIRNREKQTD